MTGQRLALLVAVAILTGAVAAEDTRTAKLVGTVTDETGKPLIGASVHIRSLQEAEIVFPIQRGKTDEDGKYKVSVRFRKSERVVVSLVLAWARGYVRSEVEKVIPIQAGEKATLDIRLVKGEPLAGVLRLQPKALERMSGIKPEQKREAFEVVGRHFEQGHLTEKGGRFEVFVPPGKYTIRAGPTFKEFEWTGLKAGSTDLILEEKPFVYIEENVGKAFDHFWKAMDNNYSYFALKKDVDWKALGEKYRPRAIKARSAKELTPILREMLAHLKDLHVWIDTPDGLIGTITSSYEPNWNRKATLAVLEEKTDCGKFAVVGKTRGEGFGYFLMVRQSAAEERDVEQAVAAIRKLHDAPGFLVDLRSANGGDEGKAHQIAGLFCGKKALYAKSKFRNGPGHGDFSRDNERWLEPAAEPYLKPVVCLIGPGAVSSGEGFVKMMKGLPHVTTVGLPTRGASGNPQPVELPGTGLAVWFSRWVDMLPDGQPFEGSGIAPNVEVRQPAEDYAVRDPTLEKSLELLRKKVAR